MELDDQNDAFHQLQRELHETCLTGDIARLRQLFADADFDAADAMEKARLQEEGKPPQVHVIASRGSDAAKGADAARSAEPKRSALKSARNKAQKAGAPDHFTAIAPGSKKTKPPRKKKA